MASYPSYGQMVGSSMTYMDDIRVDRAVGGNARVRSLFPATKSQFALVHRLTEAEVSSLMSFYTTNRLLPVDLTWDGDGQSYTCLFAGPPQVKYDVNDWFEVIVRLEQQ